MVNECNRIDAIVSSAGPALRRIGMSKPNLRSIDKLQRALTFGAANENDAIKGISSARISKQTKPRLACAYGNTEKRRADAFDLAHLRKS